METFLINFIVLLLSIGGLVSLGIGFGQLLVWIDDHFGGWGVILGVFLIIAFLCAFFSALMTWGN